MIRLPKSFSFLGHYLLSALLAVLVLPALVLPALVLAPTSAGAQESQGSGKVRDITRALQEAVRPGRVKKYIEHNWSLDSGKRVDYSTIVREFDREGLVTREEQRGAGAFHTVIFGDTNTPAYTLSRYTYNSRGDWVTHDVLDSAGRVLWHSTKSYDSLGRKTGHVTSSVQYGASTSRTYYDDQGHDTLSVDTDSSGALTSYQRKEYNKAGRLVRSTNGNATTVWSIFKSMYDADDTTLLKNVELDPKTLKILSAWEFSRRGAVVAITENGETTDLYKRLDKRGRVIEEGVYDGNEITNRKYFELNDEGYAVRTWREGESGKKYLMQEIKQINDTTSDDLLYDEAGNIVSGYRSVTDKFGMIIEEYDFTKPGVPERGRTIEVIERY